MSEQDNAPKTSEGYEFVLVDGNSEFVQHHADAVVMAMLSMHSLESVIAILLVATEQAMSSVLHFNSPMPEANIAALTGLLDNLKRNVLAHEKCALRINGVTGNEPRH